MLRSLLFVSLLIVASEARRCYSCTSAADCLSVGVGRIQECDSHTQCYTVSINGRVQLKGCTAECAHVERHSEHHACHTCQGDLCNSSPSFQQHNNQDNNIGSGVNVGSGVGIGGGVGVGGGASPHNNNNNYGSSIGNGAAAAGHGNGMGGGIGSGASVGGNGGIGGGVAPSGSHKRHYKRTIGHGAGFESSIGGGAAPVGGGAYPGGSWNSGSGGIGGGAVPDSYPSQRNGNQWNEQAGGYNGIGSGARPGYNSASLSGSLFALVAPLALFALRR